MQFPARDCGHLKLETDRENDSDAGGLGYRIREIDQLGRATRNATPSRMEEGLGGAIRTRVEREREMEREREGKGKRGGREKGRERENSISDSTGMRDSDQPLLEYIIYT